MAVFLIDKDGKDISYQKLLDDINQATHYYPVLKTDSLYDYFLNFIIGLISDSPLTLIDSDLNTSELDSLGVDNNINKEKSIIKNQFQTVDALIERVQSSISQITIFTSGTTGQPKKVVHSVGTLMRTTRISDKYLNQIWGYAYNPTHMAGLQVFFQVFINTNTFVNLFNQVRSVIYDAIEKYEITHISATPTFYRLLLPVEKSYPSVIRITLGGEKSDHKLHESIEQIFPNAKINNIYASTEAGTLFAARGESFQIPMGIQDKIKVVDDELLIHHSLLGKSDSFKFSGDFYHTGDLIEWTNKENGLFRFKSRKNELINIGGYKVNPSEVEEAILELPQILQVLVYGKPNSVIGNILCAEVKLTENATITELEIRQYLISKLQDFKIPRKIKFVNSFTLTRTGKIKRI